MFEILDYYYYQTGLQINYDKTTIYRIGSLKTSNAKFYTKNNVKWSSTAIEVLGVKVTHDNILEDNYTVLLNKSVNVLNNWANRGLSLIGKITVINTLVASLFVYKMTVLEIIPEKVVRTFESIIAQFIWSGKKAKIALKILQSAKSIGGLELVDLRKKDISLKCSWVQILDKECDYAKGIFKMHPLKEKIFMCNLHESDVKDLNIKNPFWRDMLKAWCCFNYWQETTKISNKTIWLNSRIKVGDSVIFWQDCYKNGLMYVYQLFEQGSTCSAVKMYQKYGLDFIRYNSLIAAIPKDWRTFFKEVSLTTFLPVEPSVYDRIVKLPHLSSYVYKQLIATPTDKILDKKASWCKELNVAIGLECYFKKFTDIYRLTNVNKYRSFQYRMLNRAIITNVKLFQWKIIDSPNCNFCQIERESVRHLFYECTVVKQLWEEIVQMVNDCFNVKCVLSYQRIVFNEIAEKKGVANFICLITKHYIYKKHVQMKAPNVVELKALLRGIENMEKYIAMRNMKLRKHEIKWCSSQDTSDTNSMDECCRKT